MNIRWTKFALCLVLMSGLLTACAGEQPKLIGSFPEQVEPKPLALQPGMQFVYDTWITLEVSRVDSAAELAADLTARHGGYLESTNSWLQDGRLCMSLVLAVPATGLDGLREDLLGLGRLEQEQLSSGWGNPSRDWPDYAHITLTLKPRLAAGMDWSPSGWNPERTFRQALEVFVSIFGFLVDIFIWVGVVMGPFLLIALGLRALWRKAH